MANNARRAVAQFYSAVRERAGGTTDHLIEVVRPWYGRPPSRSTVDHWLAGTGDPPSYLTFRLARHYGISLDEYAMDAEDRRKLSERLAKLEEHISQLQDELQALKEDRDIRPIDFGRSHREAGGS